MNPPDIGNNTVTILAVDTGIKIIRHHAANVVKLAVQSSLPARLSCDSMCAADMHLKTAWKNRLRQMNQMVVKSVGGSRRGCRKGGAALGAWHGQMGSTQKQKNPKKLWWVIIYEYMGNTAFIHSQSNDIKCQEAGKWKLRIDSSVVMFN